MVVITTAQLHSKNPEFGFCTGSNPACSKSEIQDGRNLCQWSRLEIWLDTFRWLTIPQKQFIITRNIRKHFFPENHKKSFQAIFFNSFFFFFFFWGGGGGGGGWGGGSWVWKLSQVAPVLIAAFLDILVSRWPISYISLSWLS